MSLSQSTTALGATQVTYTVGFMTSATGGLAAGTGTISVQAPAGTFPTRPDCSSRLTVSDLTTKASMSAPMCAQTVNSDGSRLVISPPIDIGPRDEVEVVVPSVRNPAEAGPHDLTVGTSSDGPNSFVFGSSAAHAIKDVTLSATTLAARASEVVYTIGFTTSGSGGLPAGSGTIVVQAGAGTFSVPARCGNAVATITDLVTHASAQADLCLAKESNDGAQVDLVTPVAIGAGQAVRLVITGLHNPDVPGPKTISVSTSSDAAAFTTYTVTGVGIPITALSVAASTLAAGATGVTYTLDFKTSAVGALAKGSGAIIVSGPAGTFPVKAGCGQEVATLTDLATKASGQDLCTETLTADGSQLQVTSSVAVGGGDRVQLAISGLDNPIGAGVRTLSVSTSSNSARSASYQIVAGSSVGPVSLTVSNPSAGLAGVTYGVTFALPASGTLVPDFGAIVVAAPPATFALSTACSNGRATVTDLTTKATGEVASCSVRPGTSRASLELVTPVPLNAGDKVALAVPGWVNPPNVGLQSIWLSTSSSGVPEKAQFRTVPAGPIKGRVLNTSGYLIKGAGVEACPPKGGLCFDTVSSSSGTFSDTVPYGRYVLSAFPPSTPQGDALAPSTGTSAVVVSGPSGTAGATLSMRVLHPLPGGVSVNGQEGGEPFISDFAPAPMTVRGCRNGIGVVTIQTTNDLTGKAAKIILPLLETPSGSGRYSAHIPPLWPFDGFGAMSYNIYCVEAIAPTADAAGGGNLVAIHGTGFAGVMAVRFGNTPAPRFKVLSTSLIEAVAPPGTGTVNVSVTTRSGTTGGGPLSAYTYISLASISPSHGPLTGSTTVLIRGKNLSQINSLWFGDHPGTDLRVLSNSEVEVLTPPGSGDTAVGIGQLSPLPRDLKVTGSRPTLFFDFGGTVARAGDLRAARLAPTWHREAGGAKTTSGTQGLLVARTRPSLGVFPSLAPPTLTSLLPVGACVTSVGCLCSGPGCSSPATSPSPTWGFTVGDKAWTDATTVEGSVAGALATLSGVLFTANPGSLATALASLEAGEVLTVGTFFAAGAGALVIGLGFVALLAALATVFASGTSFSVWIDPSGTVSNTVGGPVAGAVAVLEQAPTVEGPFTRVGPASPGMQPHRNPEKTGVDGQFHWDVISDYYKVVASAPGCHAPGDPAQATVSTPALPVPPPQVGLDLVLQCAHQGAPERPLVTSLSSGEALEKGGAQIEVVGSHFTPSATVRFGEAPAPSVTFESPAVLLASVPPGKGTVNVVVTTEGGTSPAAAPARLVYSPPPAITNVSPRSGPPVGGTRVTIFGTGLENAEAVRVGRTNVTNFTVKSDQAIELTVPAEGRGPVDITVTTPLGLSPLSPADRFTYRPATTIRTSRPS